MYSIFASEIWQLKEAIKSDRRKKLLPYVLFFQGNDPLHTTQVAEAETTNRGFELLTYPHYLPDLATCNLVLFQKDKSHRSGRHFGDND